MDTFMSDSAEYETLQMSLYILMKKNILIGSRGGSEDDGDRIPTTVNVVYNELLSPINIPRSTTIDTYDELDISMTNVISDNDESMDTGIFYI